jgi:parallel beta-helix repeat protein
MATCPTANAADSTFAPGRLVIQFKSSVAVPLTITYANGKVFTGLSWLDAIGEQYGLREMGAIFPVPMSQGLKTWYWLEFPLDAPILSLVNTFAAQSDVAYAQPSYIMTAETPCPPNDPFYPRLHPCSQWFHRTLQTSTSSSVWNCGAGVVGDQNVLIAVVDPDGFAYTHPDFGDVRNPLDTTIFFINGGEESLNYGGDTYLHSGQLLGNGQDSDGDSLIDDRVGWDFYRSPDGTKHPDNNIWMEQELLDPGQLYRWKEHATLMSGVIAAFTNNGVGLAGIARGWGGNNYRAGCKIIPCAGTRESYQVAQAINYAVNLADAHGITTLVFNMSFGSYSLIMPQEMRGAIDAALVHPRVKALFIASAGNEFNNNEDSTHWPSSYPPVISVAGTDSIGHMIDESNYGPTVDIAAPGLWIRTTTYPDPDSAANHIYTDFYTATGHNRGTSFSSAMASGVAALVWSTYPELTSTQVRERLLSGAVDLHGTEPAHADSLGRGELNAANAISGQINWFNTVNILQDCTIVAGRSLVISPGTTIHVATNKNVTVYGQIQANGTAVQPITFDRAGTTGVWNGLKIYSTDSQNSVSYATLRNAACGIVVYHGYANIGHVTVENCTYMGVGFGYSNGVLSYSTLQNDSVRGAVLFHSNISIHDNLFSGNDVSGLRIWGCDQILVANNTFFNNGDAHRTDYSVWPGIELLEGALNLRCNTFQNNAGPALHLLPQAYAYMSFDNGGRNKIENNMLGRDLLGYDYGQIHLQGGTVTVRCGENTIRDDQNRYWLIRSEFDSLPPDGWNVDYNYWGTTILDTIRHHVSGNPTITHVLTASVACNYPYLPAECAQDAEEMLFQQGWGQEREAQFADALTTYEDYLNQYPQGKYIITVLDRIQTCKKAIG